MAFPRPFLLHATDGTTWQGVEFHTGLACVFAGEPDDVRTPCALAINVGALTDELGAYFPGARVEWADTTTADPGAEERVARFMAAEDWCTRADDDAWWTSRPEKFRMDYLTSARHVIALVCGTDAPEA